MGNQRRQDARRAGAGVLDYSTSNDELERRCTAARLARERTLSSSARGAQPQTHYGPLQALVRCPAKSSRLMRVRRPSNVLVDIGRPVLRQAVAPSSRNRIVVPAEQSN